ncbi:major antigenic peptide/PpiC-type peptidyl-prolyl cis-trans isomerase [Campylobacter peloridis]|uniref:peptidylprolyl isomerase n=1 Tax=Campylobacter peloridis TaxID=488546 RepID=A0ABX6TS56_9BACT|nr:major antigenic peptide/PpiC-type peptidyl-prolyl cis-trans isomerase [Campylobacter peloridis]AJC84832.1 SurA-like chaperone / peptidyl-prolyl cis-trans isomerase [Campylobacter peloridis LMG 23910]QOQ88870.1 major antigenic peptide/PpiC-type peptidyl-prolyl cis-trans isomerase [Campylobacter peloridis]
MKKISLVAAALLTGLSLNAAVVATLDGQNITDTQVNEFFAPMLRGAKITDLPADQKKAVIDQYIVQQLVLKDAKAQKIENDPLYKEELERAKEAILVNIYQKKIFDSIKTNETKAKKYYDDNKAQFVKPAQVKARHILVTDEKEAKDIISQLNKLSGKALTDKFAQLAKEKSIDKGSSAQGGELGWFAESTMVKPFADAAFSMKKGTISKTPIKSDFGYHIILKEDARAKSTMSFNEVKAGIENNMKMEEFKELLNKKAEELHKKAKVEYK